jgi:hypothetical protein
MSLEREERVYDFDVALCECDLAIFVDNYSKEWKPKNCLLVSKAVSTYTVWFRTDNNNISKY